MQQAYSGINMENQISNLFSLFTQEDILNYEYTETFVDVEFQFKTILNLIPTSAVFLTGIPHISTRDKWEFKVLSEYDETEYLAHSDMGQIEDLSELEAYIGSTITLKFVISKNIERNRLSIYWLEKFSEFLLELPLLVFFNEVDRRIDSILIFECQNESIQSACTSSIALVSRNEIIDLSGVSDRMNRLRKSAGNVHWGAFHVNLLPEDLYPSGWRNSLSQALSKACGALLYMYLFDYITISSLCLGLKIDGFKSINYSMDVSKLSNIVIDGRTLNQFFEVFEWILSGGYVSDKYSIARNIISINLRSDTIAISSNVIDSIRSNFRIYEKDNVQQYIQLRNEISNLLIDLQSKINDIVEGYVNDFKSNLLVLVSFFASVIVFGVISKDSPFVYFSNQVIILSWSFILVSYLYLRYSKSEFNKRIEFFHKQYAQLETRYKPLLDDVELNNVFEDCNPDKSGTHNSYLKWQRKYFSKLWIVSLIILSVALFILFIFNNVDIIYVIINRIIDKISANAI